MATPLKDLYTKNFAQKVAQGFTLVYPGFETKTFLGTIFTKEWESLELKQRSARFAQGLTRALPKDFVESVKIVEAYVHFLLDNKTEQQSVEYMFLPDFVSQNGMDHYAESMHAMEQITQFVSCEFAIRFFIKKYPDAVWNDLNRWSKHESYKVRRLASEGCRPRLPWGMGFPDLKKDPSPILPILENLHQDPHDFVYRSVANNLNDIAKDHPELVIKICKRWKGKSSTVDWLVKHALRGLLKQGNKEALKIFGYAAAETIKVSTITLNKAKIRVGESIELNFKIKNTNQSTAKVRREYAIYFRRKNGEHGRKVFKISEKELAPNDTENIQRRHVFKQISTRKYYSGKHFIAPVVNGMEHEKLTFELGK